MISNVVINTWHGTMIVNRFDRKTLKDNRSFGVGAQLLDTGAFDRPAVQLTVDMLKALQTVRGRPIVAFDLGANIGCFSLVWSRGLGKNVFIVAGEAQSQVFYQLCGNIALNNIKNIKALHAAVGAENGVLSFAKPSYEDYGSYGSLELRRTERSENIGQSLSAQETETVPLLTLASLADRPADFIKLDVEGMEKEVLLGAETYLRDHKPMLHYEHIKLREDRPAVERFLSDLGYRVLSMRMDSLAVQTADPVNDKIKVVQK